MHYYYLEVISICKVLETLYFAVTICSLGGVATVLQQRALPLLQRFSLILTPDVEGEVSPQGSVRSPRIIRGYSIPYRHVYALAKSIIFYFLLCTTKNLN
ncbi:hypothetical protein OUZ56_029164 [Daphnia magna]|uniref:Secreted protein n=1 Tax=Daphnia magna TaxID=35525 RepID=A0ABR0B622_9CRUS|nr:hypothetical protein OUZ56_029164 [Daphnia magna]